MMANNTPTVKNSKINKKRVNWEALVFTIWLWIMNNTIYITVTVIPTHMFFCFFLINCLFKNVQPHNINKNKNEKRPKHPRSSQRPVQSLCGNTWKTWYLVVLFPTAFVTSVTDLREWVLQSVFFFLGGGAFLPPCATKISNFHAAQCPNCAPFVEEQSSALLERKKNLYHSLRVFVFLHSRPKHKELLTAVDPHYHWISKGHLHFCM